MLLRLTTVVWLSSLWATEDTKTGKKPKVFVRWISTNRSQILLNNDWCRLTILSWKRPTPCGRKDGMCLRIGSWLMAHNMRPHQRRSYDCPPPLPPVEIQTEETRSQSLTELLAYCFEWNASIAVVYFLQDLLLPLLLPSRDILTECRDKPRMLFVDWVWEFLFPTSERSVQSE